MTLVIHLKGDKEMVILPINVPNIGSIFESEDNLIASKKDLMKCAADAEKKAIEKFVKALKENIQLYPIDAVFETSTFADYSGCIDIFEEYVDAIAEKVKKTEGLLKEGKRMNKIAKVLKGIYGLSIESLDEATVYAENDMIIALVVAPHSGTKYKWLLRFSTAAAFDRWANSTAIEEFYETEDEVIKYLEDNVMQVYQQLLNYLSNEYDEMKESHAGWIPVRSGLLPEDNEEVQVTYTGYHDKQPYCNEFAYLESNIWYWAVIEEKVMVDITAWRHNCEPYRGK